MKLLVNLLRILIFLLVMPLFVGLLGAFTLSTGIYTYLAPDLPNTSQLRDVEFQVPLRVYSSDGQLMAEFAEKKREPLSYEEFPSQLVHAILSSEDDRFFEHPGVDYQGLLRASYELLRTGRRSQGGSTITMQVARNFFLTPERSYIRKLREIYLSLKIEQELSKEEILTLYLNKIYLGHRAYGVGAAAQAYYGKPLKELSLAQLAMIAGLPKAPSKYNPLADPERAHQRRNYVLRRMRELGYISPQEFVAARNEPLSASAHTVNIDLKAPYVAEMVRAYMVDKFGEQAAYTRGFNVYTTVDSRLQRAATRALRSALHEYDLRHGYRGPVSHIELTDESTPETLQKTLDDQPTIGDLLPAIVLSVEEKSALVLPKGQSEPLTLAWDDLKWARRWLSNFSMGPNPKQAAEILARGDVIHLLPKAEGGWALSQLPSVTGALVSLRPNDGAILALQGGYEYFHSKFNRVIQAKRQPGSNFKPFVYSAALENGFTVASLINDAPVVFEDASLEGTWRPENYSGRFYGPTRMRVALYKSRNLVSIRLLQSVGINRALEHVAKFGFDPDHLPHNLSLALGSANISPLELVSGYAVLANGGYHVDAYLIDRIEDIHGQLVYASEPAVACIQCNPSRAEGASSFAYRQAEQVVDPRNIYLITSMLQDVIRRGTGRRAMQLGRNDIAGKTGTTNEQRDAWFSGYNSDVVTTAWVGFDTPDPMGRAETGGRAALPMWIDYMATALEGKPEHTMAQPQGLVTVRIDPDTGLRTSSDNPNAVFEHFRTELVPGSSPRGTTPLPAGVTVAPSNGPSLTDELF